MSTKFSTRINPLSKRLRIRSSTTCLGTILKNSSQR
jgi:hypothetical protein